MVRRRGRGAGSGRQGGRDQTSGGRGQARHGNGGARENGFVQGGALGDWEATPNLASVNSRKGRTQGGVNGGASGRQQTSNGRPVSKRKHPIARTAQSTFTSVGYSYRDRDDPRSEGDATLSACVSVPREEALAGGEVEVVVPAALDRAEVVMDRRPCVEVLDNLGLGMWSTRGLGFAEEEDQSTSAAEVLQLGLAADNLAVESNVESRKDEDVAAVETMKVEPQGDHSALQLEQNTAGGKTSSFLHKSKKKMHKSRTPNSNISSGFLSIGGVRVWTDQGPTYGNEHLDEEEDVYMALDSASGKAQWGLGYTSPKTTWKRNKHWPQQTSGLSRNAHRGQWSEASSSVSEESNSDPSSSDVSDEMAEDYLSNVGVGLEPLDASWLRRDKLFEHVPIEDMVLQGLEDDRATTHANSASELSGFSDQSASPEKRLNLYHESKGKEVINAHEESNSELDELAEALHFKEGFVQSSNGEVEHETVAALWKRDLKLDDNGRDSPAGDSEDDQHIDQFFEIWEESNLTPDKIQAAGRQTVSMHASSWPINVHQGKKKLKSVPGEKKRQRKEQIAVKRQIRAQHRGFDLAAVNVALEEVVKKSVDIFAFEPMEDRDRAQIHKLASIYRLKSSSQGSGKKRFTVVTRTRHTSLPTGIDKDQLLFMLGQDAEVGMPDSRRSMTSKGHRLVKKSNSAALQASQIMQLTLNRQRSHKHYKNEQSEGSLQQRKHKMKPSGHGQRSAEKRGHGTTTYPSKPMTFVSSGIIRSQEESPSVGVTSGFPLGSDTLGIPDKGESSSREAAGLADIKGIAVVSSAIGTFEAHTRGFGSRMMLKMGFQEGQGLGKDGQGISSPVEAVKRPKSLGLGAYAATT